MVARPLEEQKKAATESKSIKKIPCTLDTLAGKPQIQITQPMSVQHSVNTESYEKALWFD